MMRQQAALLNLRGGNLRRIAGSVLVTKLANVVVMATNDETLSNLLQNEWNVNLFFDADDYENENEISYRSIMIIVLASQIQRRQR
jgi:hypothetical protein